LSDFAPQTFREESTLLRKQIAVLQRHGKPQTGAAFLAARNRNRIINGNFRTNQRGYVSGGALYPNAAQGYGFDRWRAAGVTNLIPNPTGLGSGAAAGLAASFAGWTTGSAAAGSITTLNATIPGVSHQGRILQCTPGAGSTQGFFLNGNTGGNGVALYSGLPKIVGNHTYTAAVWVKASVAKSVIFGHQPLSPGNSPGIAIQTSPIALLANTWQRITLVFTSAVDAMSSSLYCYLATGTWNAGETIQFGAAMLSEGSAASPYFDGASAGCSWVGIANASPSFNLPTPPTMTFVPTAQGQMVTLNAPFQSPIERANVEAGDYVLAWKGTSQARVYNAGATAPSYAASPVLVTLDGSDNVVVEFNAGTVSEVQLERGSTPTPFERIPVGEELAICQRYYRRWSGGYAAETPIFGTQQSPTFAVGLIHLSSPMRVNPFIAFSDLVWTDRVAIESNISSMAVSAMTPSNFNVEIIRLSITMASGGAARYFGGVYVRNFAGIGYLTLDAEL
jgi:hypothetical protein